MKAEPSASQSRQLSLRLDAYLRAMRERHLAELVDFLSIPSVSALPAHAKDVRRAAQWLADALLQAGARQSEVLQTGGLPVVLADWPAPDANAPTVLVYGHFDVQPADPIDAWRSPPFSPTLRESRIYARGASDDKGNLLIPVRAAEALAAVGGGPPVNLVFLFEGEEEIGSPNLPRLLAEHRDRLQVDAVLSADGIMLDSTRPTIALGFKGLLSLELEVSCADRDLHSGLHGGLAPNAATALSQILASLVSPDGAVLVDGFYADAAGLTESDRELIQRAGFDGEAYKSATGVSGFWGEPGYAPLERNWFRPTLDVNGVWGGFQGPGTKTVIPARAGAKVTCRLAAGQRPLEIAELVRRHIAAHTPQPARAEIHVLGSPSRAFVIERENPTVEIVRDALRGAYGCDPLDVRVGASLPVAGMIEDALDTKTVMLGWSMLDENLHAPDEFLRLESFDIGTRVYADVFQRLAILRRAGAA